MKSYKQSGLTLKSVHFSRKFKVSSTVMASPYRTQSLVVTTMEEDQETFKKAIDFQAKHSNKQANIYQLMLSLQFAKWTYPPSEFGGIQGVAFNPAVGVIPLKLSQEHNLTPYSLPGGSDFLNMMYISAEN